MKKDFKVGLMLGLCVVAMLFLDGRRAAPRKVKGFVAADFNPAFPVASHRLANAVGVVVYVGDGSSLGADVPPAEPVGVVAPHRKHPAPFDLEGEAADRVTGIADAVADFGHGDHGTPTVAKRQIGGYDGAMKNRLVPSLLMILLAAGCGEAEKALTKKTACKGGLATGQFNTFVELGETNEGVAFGPDGHLYVSGNNTGNIWSITADGVKTKFAQSG